MDCMQFEIRNTSYAGMCFNTASGMDCMQSHPLGRGKVDGWVSIPQAVWIACNGYMVDLDEIRYAFQYRKRYGLHAMQKGEITAKRVMCFNTASGMDCMQFFLFLFLKER